MTNNPITSYAERLNNLLDDRQAINEDIKAVYEEAKEAGIVTKHLRAIVAESRIDAETRADMYRIRDEYRHALGLLADLPLGQAATQRAETQPKRRGRPRKSTNGHIPTLGPEPKVAFVADYIDPDDLPPAP